jgi:hypothetical protein
MSSQHEANILGGCTLHPRKGTLKNGVTPRPHCGLGPAISQAGSQIVNNLFRSSFGHGACRAEV